MVSCRRTHGQSPGMRKTSTLERLISCSCWSKAIDQGVTILHSFWDYCSVTLSQITPPHSARQQCFNLRKSLRLNDTCSVSFGATLLLVHGPSMDTQAESALHCGLVALICVGNTSIVEYSNSIFPLYFRMLPISCGKFLMNKPTGQLLSRNSVGKPWLKASLCWRAVHYYNYHSSVLFKNI